MADDFNIRDALEALLREAGQIFDVCDRDDSWAPTASFVVEIQAHACCEALNGLEGRERYKVTKRAA
ncbi:hypothetical protein M446_6975 (plasmid) [Methylobacterium sp. 4-46]|uniref:hypothetical protein n=1 Tax=unclassified Methylobacterium TaxID=2615210 RepID=UPI000165CBFD|nr:MULTISPECIES: hypothetical protein [Methylobacterium]ACA21208.1 hypothetical protein M446_6975 [Methylobacterium sp. 4-46]WFT83777.1 hypothetical protein QA634_35475 [Methylobacterium nodulans]